MDNASLLLRFVIMAGTERSTKLPRPMAKSTDLLKTLQAAASLPCMGVEAVPASPPFAGLVTTKSAIGEARD